MKLCRFNHDRIGVIRDAEVVDVTDLWDTTPTWPAPVGDWIALQAAQVLPKVAAEAAGRPGVPLASVRLDAPIANPGKIIGAPVNYRAHQEEAAADDAIAHGRKIQSIGKIGLFLKAGSSMVAPREGVKLRFGDRRNDHEVELVVVIGKEARHVKREDALDYVLGYTVGLDMTVRGPEFPGFRKSADSYAVIGPWLVTADELTDPSDLELSLKVNGEVRQHSSTKHLIFDVPRLIEYASAYFTLHPGDIIMTGTPEGVSAVSPGDVLDAYVQGIGEVRVVIHPEFDVAEAPPVEG